MTTPSERVRGLVQKGSLPADDAGELLAAVGVSAPPSRAQLLIDPLERFDAARLCLAGLGGALAGVAVSRLGVRFDGFLDLHHTGSRFRLAVSLLDAVSAWLPAALVFWVVSLVAARQGRFVDFLALIGVARLPLVAFAVPIALVSKVAPVPVPAPGQVPALGIGVIVIVTCALASLGWVLTLAYRGFGTASGLRGPRRVVAFVTAVVLSEAASKLVLSLLA
jgi:hypothetical protein